MLSRTADHLFWMARYMERAENTARMLDINLEGAFVCRRRPNRRRARNAPVLRISELEAAFAERHDEPTREHVLDFMGGGRDQSVEHPLVSACGARERACGARHVDDRMVETINDTA